MINFYLEPSRKEEYSALVKLAQDPSPEADAQIWVRAASPALVLVQSLSHLRRRTFSRSCDWTLRCAASPLANIQN